MARLLFTLLTLLVVSTDLCFSADPPSPAPSPASDISSPPSPGPGSPADSPNSGSPGPAPASSPTLGPSADLSSPPSPSSPSPTPSKAADFSHESSDSKAEEPKKSEGMSGGTKAGIVVGVIVGAGVVGLGGFVYKKRQENLRKTQYGLEMRGSFI